MSLTSRILLGVGLALVLLACSVDAHGWMSYPKPRGQYLSPPKPSYMEYGPASSDPTADAFVCRNDPVMPKASWLPLEAGKSQAITLEFNAKHVGDCFVYLSYDGDKPEKQMKWFKIWEQHACKDSLNYNIPIPSYLPSGEHVVFRWEWYALHVYPTVEYYSQCVDATMRGAASGSLPQPQVTMPGHLPKLTGFVVDNTNNYWWPWDNQAMFFTGPQLATLNGRPNPTNAPVTSAPVTSAPVTSAPVTSAPVTSAPVTSAPTNKPTNAPPVQPTQKPATTPAPLQSVKLNVLNSVGVWWFAATISGHRATEITKVEIHDNLDTKNPGNYRSFTPMAIAWGDVWAFSAGTPGPMVFPITVKASLASGSSLSFVVNGLPATTVDSGSIFQ